MDKSVLSMSGTPMCFDMTVKVPDLAMSSTASTAACLDQEFPAGVPDPHPATEDWMNFVGKFDPSLYETFSMSAYATSVIPRSYSAVDIPSVVFRTVYDVSDNWKSARIPSDGINDSGTVWTTYSSNSSSTAPVKLETRNFRFSSKNPPSVYWMPDTEVGFMSSTPNAALLGWSASGNTNVATASVTYNLSVYGELYSQWLPPSVDSTAKFGIDNSSITTSTSTTSTPTLTRLMSAETAGPLSALCGTPTGNVSAAVGCFNDITFFDSYGVDYPLPPPEWTATAWHPLRYAWYHGTLTSAPYGCGMSGAIELKGKDILLDSTLLITGGES